MSIQALEAFDFVLADGNADSNGLVDVRAPNSKLANLRIDERAAVFDARLLEHIHYIYFRRFGDNRSSHIAAYITDNSVSRLSDDQLAKIHSDLWIHGVAPLWYVSSPTRVDILSCARGQDFWDDVRGVYRYWPVQPIELAARIDRNLRQRYSAFRLADGTFWDDPSNARLANHDKAAHKALIQAIIETDQRLEGEEHPVRRRLLLLMVLVKYLEDRQVFPSEGWFGTHFLAGARSFKDLLASGDPECVKKFLGFMEDRFNGDIFCAPDGQPWQLSGTELRQFFTLTEARTLMTQRHLWTQFNFRYLPVEVISHLYERFIHSSPDHESTGSKKSKVYTPPILAALLLDQVMPYDTLTGHERVLDPACGSGIFLIGAFRRLVTAWRSRNHWKIPPVSVLNQILRDSIFGVDLDGGALDLAAFSLALGVCDALQPKVIWDELKFERLREGNLFQEDFFEVILNKRRGNSTVLEGGFNVIVGNPPFESSLTKAGIQLEKIASANRVKPSNITSKNKRLKLPDKQIAYLFLEQSTTCLQDGGRTCLLQPSGFLYNRKAEAIRQWFTQAHTINAAYDFTSIRGLFEAADTKAIAIDCGAAPPMQDHFITHLTFRRTASIKERVAFEIDHYDWHRVPQLLAVSDRFVWRLNLLGGGRIHEISRRLRLMPSLAEFVERQKLEQGWDWGEGYIVGNKEPRISAEFLTDLPDLPTTAFTEDGIDTSKIGRVVEKRFRSPYTLDRYSPPLVLIKENSSLPVGFWDDGPLAYRDKIVGIHAPEQDRHTLREVYEKLMDERVTLQFALSLHGSQALVGKATAILKQDVELLPFPKDTDSLRFVDWEEAIRDDTLDYMTDYVRLGQESELLRLSASEDELLSYAATYVRMLGSVYTNLSSGKPIVLDGLVCQPFYFGEQSQSKWLMDIDPSTDSLRVLVHTELSPTLRSIRVVRFYDQNTIFIIKPDRLRYWIRSAAIRDADDTLVDLTAQGW